jgi:hypothetical protein
MGSAPETGLEGFLSPASNQTKPMPVFSLRRTVAPAVAPLEKALLRRSVGQHHTLRHRCVHCERTPLTGEVVHLYGTAAGERLVCELCRPLRRETPARSELMHAPEHERSVRLMARAA